MQPPDGHVSPFVFLLPSSHKDWMLPRSHLSDPLARASLPWCAGAVPWCHWDVPCTAGSWEGASGVPAAFWHSEAAQWWVAGVNLGSFSFCLCLFAQVCPLPPMVSHGDYICHPRPCERYNHGTVVEFYCDPGYTLTNDYKYITCQYGEWFPSYQVYCVKTGKG